MTMQWEWSRMGGRTVIAGLPPRQPWNCNCASALLLTSATAPRWRLGLGGSPALVAVPLHCHWHWLQPRDGGWALEAFPHWWLCLCIAIDIGRSTLMGVVPWRQSRIGGCASALPLASEAGPRLRACLQAADLRIPRGRFSGAWWKQQFSSVLWFQLQTKQLLLN